MSFTGQIVDGTVVLDEPGTLPNGTKVSVEPIEPGTENADTRPTFLERLGDVVGQAVGLPEDASNNVDHYLYGHPKRRRV